MKTLSWQALSDVPRLRVVLPLSLLARIHLSALPIALAFLITGWTGSYTAAALVSAPMAVGQGIAGPLRGKAADRGAASTVLFVTGGGYAASLTGLVLAAALLPRGAWPVATAISFVTGLTLPPISQISRALWPRMADGEARESLYVLEAVGYELVAMGGPLLAAAAVSVAGGSGAVILCAVLAVGGSLSFGLLLRAAGLDRSGPDRLTVDEGVTTVRQRSLLRDTVFLRAVLIPLLLIATVFSVTFSLVAWAQGRGTPAIAGVLDAVFALGSAAGGLLLGVRANKNNGAAGMAGLATGMGVLALLLPPTSDAVPAWLLAIALALTGTMSAPSIAASYGRIGDVAPQERRAEAFGWVATATTVGAAVTLPVSGVLLDRFGPAASIGWGMVTALAAAALALTLPKPAAAPDEATARPEPEPG
ncbi:MFS transporter [Streptomyces avermitilis]